MNVVERLGIVMLADGPVPDSRTRATARGHWLPRPAPPGGHRVVAAAGQDCATPRIRAHLVAARGTGHRKPDRSHQPMEDPVSPATIQALAKAVLARPATAPGRTRNLAWLTICKAISLSLEHGNTDASCVAYTNVARVAGRIFGDYRAGFQFGELGCQLVERRGLKRYEPRTYLSFSVFVARWSQPVRTCGAQLQRAFDAANRVGDVPSAAFTRNNLVSNLLFAGEPLPALQGEAERGVAYAREVRFGIAIGFSASQLAVIRTLRGLDADLRLPGWRTLQRAPHRTGPSERVAGLRLLVLDPETAGTLFCRRPGGGHGCRRPCQGAALVLVLVP